jgi:membrane protein implicated in regulation of membrane protease activity
MFFLGPVALAAGAAAIVAAAGTGWAVSSCSGRSIARFACADRARVRRTAVRHQAALVGARAVVFERVDADGGRVKIGGEVWSARALDEHSVIEPGARVQVAEIQGATALVYE